jgi:hypothetical protein
MASFAYPALLHSPTQVLVDLLLLVFVLFPEVCEDGFSERIGYFQSSLQLCQLLKSNY